MSKDLSTKNTKVVDRPEKALAYPLDHLYDGQCDVCGRGVDSEHWYSISTPNCDILRVYCSIDCMSQDVSPQVKALLVRHYREKLQPKRAIH